MYKKHLEHFLMVSLKHFFDFDYSYFHNAYLMLLTIPFMVKLMIIAVSAYLYDGLVTVKDDLNVIKSSAVNVINSQPVLSLRESIVNGARMLKSSIGDRRLNIR